MSAFAARDKGRTIGRLPLPQSSPRALSSALRPILMGSSQLATPSSPPLPHKTQSPLAFDPLHPTFAPVPPLTPLFVIPSLLD